MVKLFTRVAIHALAAICLIHTVKGQGTTQTQTIPDCSVQFSQTITAGTSASLAYPGGNGFDNRLAGCQTYTVQYTVTVTSGTFGSVTFQAAQGSTAPGSFSTWGGSVVTGANPSVGNTATINFATGCAASTECNVVNSWVRVVVAKGTLVGSITGTLYGWKAGRASAGGGGGGGGGGPTIAGTANEIAVAGAGCTGTGTCTISIPNNPVLPGLVTGGGFNSTEAVSGYLGLSGLTSGTVSQAVNDIAGTGIVYVWPSTNGVAGQTLQDTGVTTCPTLPASAPAVCHLLAWVTATGGAAIQVNGNPVGTPGTINFAAGSNMAITSAGSSLLTVTFASNPTSGGGVIGYSASALTLPAAGTTFIPPIGGGLPSTTETNVQATAPIASSISNMYVVMSAAIGAGNTVTFTYRDNASSQTLTCTISGASAKTCFDTVHSFTPNVSDQLSIQITTTGTVVVAPSVQITTEYGVVGGGGGGGASYKYTYYPAGVNSIQTGWSITGTFFGANLVNLPAGVTGSIGVGLSSIPTGGAAATMLISSIPATWDGSAITLDVDALFNTTNAGNASLVAYSACLPVNTGFLSPTWSAAGSTVTVAAPVAGTLEVARWALVVPVTGCVAGNLLYVVVNRLSDTYPNAIFLIGGNLGIKY